MLEVRDICVRYPNGVEALTAASLSAAAGEIVALLGRSGSGKSTLLRCINGLQPIVSGSITLDDVEVSSLSAAALLDAAAARRVHLAGTQPGGTSERVQERAHRTARSSARLRAARSSFRPHGPGNRRPQSRARQPAASRRAACRSVVGRREAARRDRARARAAAGPAAGGRARRQPRRRAVLAGDARPRARRARRGRAHGHLPARRGAGARVRRPDCRHRRRTSRSSTARQPPCPTRP